MKILRDTLGELEALVFLASIPRVGSVKVRQLVQFYGSARDTLRASAKEIEKLPGFGRQMAHYWEAWKRDGSWKQNFDLALRLGVEIIPYTSQMYPKLLLELPDHPIVLYVKGDLSQTSRSLAIVGTRQATIYGLEVAEKMASDLAGMGFTIVSGLARGIDTAAHRGALQQGKTIAVIGSGLADIYPAENRALAQTIAEKGALVSEFPMATPPDRQNFPQRNRIVSGMTLGTLLIEGPLKSGSMLTMERALSQKRRMFAVPGRVDQPNYKGNHALIKAGCAVLVESAEDVADAFNDLFGCMRPSPIVPQVPQLEKEEVELLNQMPDCEVSLEELVAATKLPVMKINILLMGLLLKKAVKEFPGKVFKKAVVCQKN